MLAVTRRNLPVGWFVGRAAADLAREPFVEDNGLAAETQKDLAVKGKVFLLAGFFY